MPSAQRKVVVLGTGGTIAGTSQSALDNTGYRAGQVAVHGLIDAVPALAAVPLEAEQVAQIDSKDMGVAVWQALARRIDAHLQRADVAGIVVTHGTDTLEETAYFMQRVLAPAKPVVLTAAMRPATSLQADGPQNLLDAVTVAVHPQARGVVAVLAGTVHSGADLRKLHTYRLDAFTSGDAGALARIEEGRLRVFRPWPEGDALGLAWIDRDLSQWPRVEIVINHAGSDGAIVDALLAIGIDGLVIAGTGNGTVSEGLMAAARRALAAGVKVIRASRCAIGAVVGGAEAGRDEFESAGSLSPVQARIELLLRGPQSAPVQARGIKPRSDRP
ncbi:MAG: asparaginase [Rubrivivax sp.]